MFETDSPFRDIPQRVTIFDLLDAEGIPHKGKDAKMKSPLRDEKTPSFSVFRQGLKWKDHASGEHGDVFDLWHALYPGNTAKEAIAALARIGNIVVKSLDPGDLPTPSGRYRRKLRPGPLGEPADPARYKIEPYEKSLVSLELRIGVPYHLLHLKKGIEIEAIHRFMAEGSIATAHDHGLAYLMQRGIKERPKAETSHNDFWLQGKGSECVFRGEALLEAEIHSDARLKVLITEGETDCLVLQEELWNRSMDRSFVLGAHGGSWVPDFRIARRYLRGRQVFIIGDNDRPGDDFADRLAAHLKDVGGCESVRAYRWPSRELEDCNDIGEARQKKKMDFFISSLLCKDSWM